MKLLLGFLLAAVVGFALWVRLAPSDPARWHVTPPAEPAQVPGGAIQVVEGDAALFARLLQVADTTPRTTRLAGDAQAGHVTFLTRSAFWRFPDYTTLMHIDGQIRLYARLRFGRSDFGVNGARLRHWLQAAQTVDG